ncbi:unnamed protein product [Rotaria sordida]|uniref:Peptidoglycan recognition protein family domain-containing protein n=1 Tax=Rotaria sordida TaxID=392033 RepID=A0A818RBZ4_9BILA|nr:unnamed protein product [Rotaria sordida]
MISQVQTKQNLFFCITIRTKKEEIVHKNGRKPTSITNLTGKPLSFYVIHHTYQPPNCYDDDECIQRVQAIQDLHQNDQGWVDIGYHFLVGICIIGDFRTSSPNEKALEAIRLWIDCGIERGHVTEAYYIITHRQL